MFGPAPTRTRIRQLERDRAEPASTDLRGRAVRGQNSLRPRCGPFAASAWGRSESAASPSCRAAGTGGKSVHLKEIRGTQGYFDAVRRFIQVLMVGVLAAPVVYLIVWPIVFRLWPPACQ